MAKKVKTKIEKSVSMYDTTFTDAVWQSDLIKISNDNVYVNFKLYNDSTAADDSDVTLNENYAKTHFVTVDPPAGKVTACLAQISANTDEEKLSVLSNAFMSVVADIEIADEDSPLYGGTKL